MTDWKPFPGLEDKYEISSDFRLRKVQTPKPPEKDKSNELATD